MNIERIRIQKIKSRDLYKFACQGLDEVKRDNIIPITKPLALALANNPCAGADDIGLLVAYAGDKCLGYLGLMPGLLKVGNSISKIYWFSSWYVPAKFRATSVGGMLIINALSLRYDIVTTGLSRAAIRVLRGMGLPELRPLEYCVIDIYRINLLSYIFYLLQRILTKIGVKQIITNSAFCLPERFLSFPVKKVIYNVLSFLHKHKGEDISYEEVSALEEKSIEQTQPNINSAKFYRNVDVMNWMLKYNWMPEYDKAEKVDLNYYFFKIRDVAKIVAVKVFAGNEKEYKGFFALSISAERMKRTAKVLDFNMFNKNDYKYIAPIMFEYARKYLADYIELPKDLERYINNNIVERVLLRKKKRVYFCRPKDKNSPLALFRDDITLDYCDGDIAFT